MEIDLFLWKYWHHNYRAINIQIFQFYSDSDFNASELTLSKQVFEPSTLCFSRAQIREEERVVLQE